MKTILISALVLVAAQDGPKRCDSPEIWNSWLGSQYNEKYVFSMMGPSDLPVRVWIDPVEGDWTMLEVVSDDLICEFTFGSEWPAQWRE